MANGAEAESESQFERWLVAITGGLAVAFNVAGVVALQPTPSAYRPDMMGAWLDEVWAAPVSTATSAICFTLGVLFLLLFAYAFARARSYGAGSRWINLGCIAVSVGSLMNAAATLAPLVAALHLPPGDFARPAAMALLGLSLSMDALFNLLLGAGLCLIGAGLLLSKRAPVWLGVFVAIAGAATVPVCLQIFAPWAADWLRVAGPLWLLAIVFLTIDMARTRKGALTAPVI